MKKWTATANKEGWIPHEMEAPN